MLLNLNHYRLKSIEVIKNPFLLFIFLDKFFRKVGDEIIVTEMEHHSNIVPWQLVCAEKGAEVVPVPMDDRGVLDMEAFDRLLNDRVRFVSVVHTSNSLGTVNPVAMLTAEARAADALSGLVTR